MVSKYTFTDRQKQMMLQWADWLDTTNLPQTRRALKRHEFDLELEEVEDIKLIDHELNPIGYCCLGLYVQYKDPGYFGNPTGAHGEYQCHESPVATPGVGVGEFFNTSYLPSKLARELGIYYSQSKEQKNGLQHDFASLNDDFEFSFKQIATEIRNLVDTGSFSASTQRLLIHASKWNS